LLQLVDFPETNSPKVGSEKGGDRGAKDDQPSSKKLPQSFSSTIQKAEKRPSNNSLVPSVNQGEKEVNILKRNTSFFFFLIHLFTCAYIIWVISPSCPHHPTLPLLPSRQNLFCAFLQFC
jgi:hypothetical protein